MADINWIHENACIVHNDKVFNKSSLDQIKNSIKKQILQCVESINKKEKIVVGVYLNRSVYTYISMIAIFELGLTYLPLDPEYPKSRLDFMLLDSDCAIVITNMEYKVLFSLPIVFVENLEECNDFSPHPSVDDSEVAYIIYTSGTTGYPKGVTITYKSLKSYVYDFIEKIPLNKDLCLISFTNPCFDLFFNESVLPIFYGMTVVIGNTSFLGIRRILHQIKEYHVDTYVFTPSKMQLFLELAKTVAFLQNAKFIMLGGEGLPINLLNKLQNNTSAFIYNLYGPTEATVFCTYANLTQSKTIHAGKPFTHSKILIDQHDGGSLGEILISGDGIFKEYLNQPDLTAQKKKYINNEIFYRSGDLGYINDQDNLVVVGRIDEQIKFNGHRIELNEIESLAERIDNINKAIAFVSFSNRLILVYSAIEDINPYTIIKYLEQYLPRYMIPSKVDQWNSLPINKNGKIDRKEIKKMYTNDFDKDTIKQKVREIIEGISGQKYDEDDIDLRRFDSIIFIQVIMAIEEEYDFEFDEEVLSFENLSSVEKIVDCMINHCK